MELKLLNKIIFYILFFTLCHTNLNAQNEKYFHIYNDSIPNKIEFNMKDIIVKKNYDLILLSQNKSYNIFLLDSKNHLSKFQDRFGTKGRFRILFVDNFSDKKISLIINDDFGIKRNKNIITITYVKTPIRGSFLSNPIILDESLDIKELTYLDYKNGNISLQDIKYPCKIKKGKLDNITITSLFDFLNSKSYPLTGKIIPKI